ncbi:MAG: hypothetical protein MUF31_08140 [Akkermansiaceae bacterium]|jgi:hypothetical protein|nr:hypothetical protein [Akkermansiaceae bacterium]
MNTHPIRYLFIPLAVMAVAAEPPVMRDAATHDDLVRVHRAEQARAATETSTHFVPAEGADPSVENAPGGILERSDIIRFGELATIVPKGAILHIPAAFADRVGEIGNARLVIWPEFYAVNRAWIDACEIPREVAEGNQRLDEKLELKFNEGGRLVVAVLAGGPVSRLPFKPAEPAPDAGTPAETAATQVNPQP